VKFRTFPLCLLGVLFLGSLASPQQEHPTEAPGKLEIAKHPLILEPPIGPQTQKLDPVKLHEEAAELAKLAQSVPADIDQVAQGRLPKDVSDKLKRIEKLSKHLRGELVP
jgi:hypothetical protein